MLYLKEVKLNKYLLVFMSLSVLITTGCQQKKVMLSPGSYSNYDAYSFNENDNTNKSLFAGDAAILSDMDIQRILAFEIVPQKQNRIAVMPFGQNFWLGWSDELSKSGAQAQNAFISKLKTSDFVHDASFLPTLLVPKEKSIPRLREAAARYQADFLLVYNSSCQSYEKYKMFAPDKSKAYCNVEALLLDTRTGIVPFTTLVSKDFTAIENAEDINFYDTIRKAELKSIESALLEIGEGVVHFLRSK